MNINDILKKINEFDKLTIDCILFEAQYPILFTCTDSQDNLYLIICCQVLSKEITLIGTKTSSDIIIDLLSNKITIRKAFEEFENEKFIIHYYGNDYFLDKVDISNMDNHLLPTPGEYMDSQDNEYEQEINYYSLKKTYKQTILNLEPKTIQYFHQKSIIQFTSSLNTTVSFSKNNIIFNKLKFKCH
ncbi:hypothetical protein [Thomasclavelia sp.]|uniref:hypothetical protein n=1 Tax=Thomasclavelia sp. TaxID=3025757 RepID=UPI0025EBCAE3|nr:hypothetical protein [Thomasclavelia sp.]